MNRLAFILILFCAFFASAATYVVSPSGGDYTTIQGAFDGVDLSPGDIVEVRAATVGGRQVYQEQVIPGANDCGAAGNPVTLRARHGDTIVIDGQMSQAHSIWIQTPVSDFVVNGFQCTNWTTYAIRLGVTTNVVVQSNRVDATFSTDTPDHSKMGYLAQGARSCIFEWNVLRQEQAAWECSSDADGFQIQNTVSPIIRYNDIEVVCTTTDQASQHNDCIQTMNMTNGTLLGNKCSMPINQVGSVFQGVYIETYGSFDFGTIKVYANKISGHFQQTYALHFSENAPATYTAQIFNNTVEELAVVTATGGAPFRDASSAGSAHTILMTNNLWINKRTDVANSMISLAFSGWFQTVASDYNHFYTPNFGVNDDVAIGAAGYPLATWQAMGYDTHSSGMTTDPMINADWTPQEGSPLIAAGINLSSYFTTDANGNTRPASAAWTIGAFEYSGSPNPPVTPGRIGVVRAGSVRVGQ